MNLRKVTLSGLLAALLLLTIGLSTALAQETFTASSIGVTNVRSGPGTTYSVIGRLFAGDSVTVNGRNSTSNTWFRIDYDGTEGWVSASLMSFDGDPTSLDVVGASNAESVTGNTGVTATLTGNANIRFEPSTSSRVIEQGEEGDSYDVTGRTAFGDTIFCRGSQVFDSARGETPSNVWLRINFNGVNAWVNYTVVSVSGNLCDVAVAEADDFDQIVAQGEVLVITQDNVRLRASNYENSDVLDTIPYDTSLVADARNDDGSRIRVTYDGQTGWISSAYVTVTAGAIDDLPVELA
jgi:uncharacterized protein YgiM (DUF1202 family)